jgi:hypothetical protein
MRYVHVGVSTRLAVLWEMFTATPIMTPWTGPGGSTAWPSCSPERAAQISCNCRYVFEAIRRSVARGVEVCVECYQKTSNSYCKCTISLQFPSQMFLLVFILAFFLFWLMELVPKFVFTFKLYPYEHHRHILSGPHLFYSFSFKFCPPTPSWSSNVSSSSSVQLVIPNLLGQSWS